MVTKLICIGIDKPKFCPYRAICLKDDEKKGMVCLRSNKLCPKDNTFPDWCTLIDGEHDDDN